MSSKRGRPISAESHSSIINQRRQKTRERMQRLRERQNASTSTLLQTIEGQLQQSEQIVDLVLLPNDEATFTSAQLGLRIQGIPLAEDLVNAKEQTSAIPHDEHIALYGDVERNSFFRQFMPATPAILHSRRSSLEPNASALSQSPSPEPNAPALSQSPSLEPNAPALSQSPSPALIQQSDNPDLSNPNLSSRVPSGNSIEQNVVNEHSTHSAEASNTEEREEENSIQYTIRKLYDQLLYGFHGCTNEEHQEKLRHHIASARDNHHSLGTAFNDHQFPSALKLDGMMSRERIAQDTLPSASQWQAMFCGTSRLQRFPRNVCLHTEQTQAAEPQIAFDIDSFLGFATSLAMARKGIFYRPVPRMHQNMKADIHIPMPPLNNISNGDFDHTASTTTLRNTPHFLMGRVHGAVNIAVYVLFPHLPVFDKGFTSLTQEQYARWADDVYLPALHQFYAADYMQHLPASYQHANVNSKAHQTEGRTVETASYGSQRSIGYYLQPEHLDALWATITAAVSTTPGLAHFREPQLFFCAKGTKLEFKTNSFRPTLFDAMQHFEAYFEDILNPDFVDLDHFYVDVGKEICPPSSVLPRQHTTIENEAQVYLWKRCCLQKYMHWMYDGQPPKQGKGQQYFSQHMLYDAASLTSVTPKRSRQREGGLIYSQFYASIKEVFDATNCYPFCNDGLEEMALDPTILHGARSAAGGRAKDMNIVEQAYLASKRRARIALRDSKKKSFGIREEHRMSWRLFQALKRRLEYATYEADEFTLLDCPAYAWPIKTSTYLDFLWQSADKFATGFEIVRAQCSKVFVTWEQTKMMAMFLRCLRFVLSASALNRESALWWSKRERSTGDPLQFRVWYGLGFSNTLPRYKYCWLEPRIDWDRLQFKSTITDHVLFGNNILRTEYLRHGGQVHAFFNISRQLEVAVDWLTLYRHVPAIRVRIISWIVHICLRQFRIDVFQHVKTDVQPEYRNEAVKGSHMLCLESLRNVMNGGVYLKSGNRSEFKVPLRLGYFLFDFNDGRVRKHWEDRPFRKLYQRAAVAVKVHGREVYQQFQECFWFSLFRYHWVLPNPCCDTFMAKSKQGQRLWYSIRIREGAENGIDVRDAQPEDWEWARKGWQTGSPPELPYWITWDKEEWEEWIDMRSGFRAGGDRESARKV